MGFGSTILQLWATLATILSAIEYFAKGLKNLGMWTDEATGTFVDESRVERQKKLATLNAELAHTEATAAADAKSSATKKTTTSAAATPAP